MGAKSLLNSIPSSKDSSLAAKALQLPWQIYLWWRKEVSIRRAIRELEQLDDHALKDMGFDRGSIEYCLLAHPHAKRIHGEMVDDLGGQLTEPGIPYAELLDLRRHPITPATTNKTACSVRVNPAAKIIGRKT